MTSRDVAIICAVYRGHMGHMFDLKGRSQPLSGCWAEARPLNEFGYILPAAVEVSGARRS